MWSAGSAVLDEAEVVDAGPLRQVAELRSAVSPAPFAASRAPSSTRRRGLAGPRARGRPAWPCCTRARRPRRPAAGRTGCPRRRSRHRRCTTPGRAPTRGTARSSRRSRRTRRATAAGPPRRRRPCRSGRCWPARRRGRRRDGDGVAQGALQVVEGALGPVDRDVRVLLLERRVERLDLLRLAAADLLVPHGERDVAELADVGLDVLGLVSVPGPPSSPGAQAAVADERDARRARAVAARRRVMVSVAGRRSRGRAVMSGRLPGSRGASWRWKEGAVTEVVVGRVQADGGIAPANIAVLALARTSSRKS